MVGAATKNDRIRNFGVGELYEAIASAIIVGIFLYVARSPVDTNPYVIVISSGYIIPRPTPNAIIVPPKLLLIPNIQAITPIDINSDNSSGAADIISI